MTPALAQRLKWAPESSQ
uniref:Uncharacterized protein n=1 Tax=Arundo donax TaxID=35708 RepID=A0A0A9AM96_ARUDO